jgi:hypothetical protein
MMVKRNARGVPPAMTGGVFPSAFVEPAAQNRVTIGGIDGHSAHSVFAARAGARPNYARCAPW